MKRPEIQLPHLSSALSIPLIVTYSGIFCSLSHENQAKILTQCPSYKPVLEDAEEEAAILLPEKQMVSYHNILLCREVRQFNTFLPCFSSPARTYRRGTQMTSLGLMALLLFLFLSWGLTAYIFIVTRPFQLIQALLFLFLLFFFSSFFPFLFSLAVFPHKASLFRKSLAGLHALSLLIMLLLALHHSVCLKEMFIKCRYTWLKYKFHAIILTIASYNPQGHDLVEKLWLLYELWKSTCVTQCIAPISRDSPQVYTMPESDVFF